MQYGILYHGQEQYREPGSACKIGPMHSASKRPILIAGGGPVGVITALALARQGLAVHVFEAEADRKSVV